MALDRTKDFGTVIGDSEGRCYEQDGQFFGSDGEPWNAPKGRRATKTEPDAPADDQLSAQMGG